MIGLLQRQHRAGAPKPLEPARIRIGDDFLDVVFRRHAQARRLVLRLDGNGQSVLVTVPNGVSRVRALEFTERSRDWIAQHLKTRGDAIHLAPGHEVPIRGKHYLIRHVASPRGAVMADHFTGVLHVPGELPHVKRRILDWLKAAARADVTAASARYAAAMGVSYRRISVRDQRSRWGSCSAGGDLSYSWRLILAPDYVLDYVAAHEVAHLKHHDHSQRFWRLVLAHCPHASRAKAWLKAHGQDVHRVVV